MEAEYTTKARVVLSSFAFWKAKLTQIMAEIWEGGIDSKRRITLYYVVESL